MSVSVDPTIKTFRIGASPVAQLPLALGGSWFVPYSSPGAEDANILGAITASYEQGIRHFDTGAGYGGGHSEELYGQFLIGRRDSVFLASKSDPKEATSASMIAEVEASLRRLRTDRIDLYYIHWPKAAGVDMRPIMEGLESLRASGKLLAVGVSNFSVPQMQEVQQVGTIDAHQLGYNLLWRFAEEDVIPFCQTHQIAVVSYSTLAHGILTGKFGRDPGLREGDQRHRILPFRADIWPHVYEGVERLKSIATRLERTLMELALRWTMARPGIASVLMGARNREQAAANARALSGAIPSNALEEMTGISDDIVKHMPRENNLFDRKG